MVITQYYKYNASAIFDKNKSIIGEKQYCIFFTVTPLKNLLETARQLGAGKFVKYLEQSGLAQELSTEGPFTLFAPSDEVFRVSFNK